MTCFFPTAEVHVDGEKEDTYSQPQMRHFNQKDSRITPLKNRNLFFLKCIPKSNAKFRHVPSRITTTSVTMMFPCLIIHGKVLNSPKKRRRFRDLEDVTQRLVSEIQVRFSNIFVPSKSILVLDEPKSSNNKQQVTHNYTTLPIIKVKRQKNRAVFAWFL